MTLEERVRAVKAKFEEAADELLALVSESPSQVSDIMRIARPSTEDGPSFSVSSELVERLQVEGHPPSEDRLSLPWEGRFLQVSSRSVRHEKEPVDVLIPEGEVFVLVNVWPENPARTQAFRELNAGAGGPEEIQRRLAEISEAEEAGPCTTS